MKCPVCKKVSENLREHALNHVRADEAYAIETWDDAKHKAKFVLHTLAGPLNLDRIKSLKQMLGPSQSLIYGGRLRQIQRKQESRKRD
jgi:hypothetical protein